VDRWHIIQNAADLPTPALAIFPERVRANIQTAIQIAGGPERLRPHIKTHKMSAIVRMHLEAGIFQFKCATIAEAEMAAGAGAKDLLVAAQLAGANLGRLQKLRRTFPETVFSTICDDVGMAGAIAKTGAMPVWIDVNCGMNRTGAAPEDVPALHSFILKAGLPFAGLHAYDGHIHEPDVAQRKKLCEEAFAAVEQLRASLENCPVIAGGTPTFPLHAAHGDRELSPGTYVFWDFGYQKFADLPFQIAALVVTRVLSKPASNCLCLDLGHKAVASENPQPRVQFIDLPDASPIMHSEEHLVIETSRAAEFKVGDMLYGVPRHICPTVALHDEVYPVMNGRAGGPWAVEARRRRISI
jgi:D-serine deaminase-like pyridoxal phosphate-dependent protein